MRPRSSSALGLAIACAAATWIATPTARADLTDDAARLVEKWSAKSNTSVDHLAPLFLEQGRMQTVRLTAAAKPGEPTKTAPKNGCTAVVLVAPRTSEFAFLTDAEDTQPIPPPSLPTDHPTVTPAEGGAIRSKAGVATLERCGKEETEHPLANERLLVQSTSPRTAIEILVIRSAAPIDPAETILPERAIGPSAPRGDAGRPIDPGPVADRLQRAEKRSREAGASHVVKVSMKASATGAGQFVARLTEGCHALDVVAELAPGSLRVTDVDAEAHLPDGGRLLARDRGESTDAHLDFCIGESTAVEVSFLGAAGPVAVTLMDAHWPIPNGIPAEWGPDARADIATALRRRHAPALPPAPIETILGVQGETLAPFAVEPGQCYLAVATLVRGEPRSIRAAIEIGDRAPHDEISDRAEAAQIAFCATTEDHAALRVHARGAQPWWVAMIWRMGP